MSGFLSKKNLIHLLREYAIVVFIILLAVLTAIVEPQFLSVGNLTNIMRQFGPLIMVALGMTFVIIAGFIDLSVGGIMSLVAVVTISLIEPLGQIPALLIGILFGAACGGLNSLIILISGAITQAEALFITYGMWVVYRALALIYTGGSTKHLDYHSPGSEPINYSIFSALGKGTLGLFSVSFIVFVILLIILYVFQSKTYLGRAISLTGGNKTAARLAGISIKGSIMSVYVISGIMTAIGSIIYFSRVTTASPVLGNGFETNAILAVVLGGASLTGGKGNVLRTALGTFMVILMANCMNLLGASTHVQYLMRGAVLILVVLLDKRK